MSVGFEDWKTWRQIYNRLEELKTSIDKLTKALSSIGTDSLQMKIIAGYLNILDAPLGYFSKKYLAGHASSYILVEEAFAPTTTSQDSGTVQLERRTWMKMMEMDFDLKCEQNLKLEGKFLCTVKYSFTTTDETSSSFKANIKLQKVVNSTATDIVSVWTQQHTVSSIGTTTVQDSADEDVPLTSFGDGDIIRLHVEVWGYRDAIGPGDYSAKIFFDPREPDTFVFIPFSLEQWLP